MSVVLFLQVVGTIFFVASAFNANIRGTSSLGIGASLWAVSLLV